MWSPSRSCKTHLLVSLKKTTTKKRERKKRKKNKTRSCIHYSSNLQVYMPNIVGSFTDSYYYYIDGRIYFNLSKLTQSAAGLKALKPAANGCYLMCKSLPSTLLFTFTVQKYILSFCNYIIYE